jgi:branched-chain amino acid transport system ATP-binding protein
MLKAESEDLLKVEGLTKAFGGLTAIKDVSFSIRNIEILGLIGPNGAGKTTLFNLISGLLPLDTGKILLGRDDITGLSAHEILKKGIARTFQGIRIFRKLTFAQNFAIARHCRLKKQLSVWGDEVAESVAEFLKLSDLKDALSGDARLIDQTLLGLGMALCTEPKMILLDEPSAGLNLSEVTSIMGIIEGIKKKGVPILLIEHNMKAVMNICDRIVALDHGEKIAEGSPIEISRDKNVIKAYLGSKYAA